YIIHRDYQYVAFIPFTESTWTDTNVDFGETYRYQVRAQAPDNTYSGPSAIQSIVVGSDVTPPSAPQNVTLVVEADGSITVDWDPSTDDVGVDSYLIHRNWNYRAWTDDAVTDFSDDQIDPGTRYRYQVRARDAAGNISEPSELVAVTP
ncbi:MAG: fibronectin type III domain-containing protein, partial [Actinomycetota bacterium]